jgi:hypothetical protein
MRTIITFLACTMLFFVACKNIDQTLIGEIQNRVSEFDLLKGEFDGMFKQVGQFSEKAHGASDAVKADSLYIGYLSLVETITGKGNNRMNEMTEAQAQLNSILVDYNSGAKKTDEVRKEYQRINKMYDAQQENLTFMAGKLAKANMQLDSLALALEK